MFYILLFLVINHNFELYMNVESFTNNNKTKKIYLKYFHNCLIILSIDICIYSPFMILYLYYFFKYLILYFFPPSPSHKIFMYF